MWIKRDILSILERLVKQRPVVVLTGARQTGKTTLLKRAFQNHHFVSLDLPAEASEAELESARFIEKNPPPLVVDEVQHAPGLFRYLKKEVDRNRKSYGQFILTGSQKFLLMQEVSDSLAGRVAILELETLSFTEISTAFPKLQIEDVLIRGGYPELYAEPDLDAREYYRSYLATYLERDVRALLNVGSLRDFERFIRACALRSGQMLNKSELARDVGIGVSTAGEWLSVLSASNQVILLEPWFSNGSKSIVKTPKLYLADSGMLLFLLNIRSFEELEASPYAGAVWETFAFSELRKRQIAEEGGWSLFYWRDRTREVDFLIHRGGRFELMEAKFGQNPTMKDAQKIEQVVNILGKKNIISASILCRAPSSFQVTPLVRAENLTMKR